MVLFLSVTAYDRLVAISRPLHYVTIMNTQLCVGLVVTAWMVGFVHSISQLALMLPLPFCGPSVLDNFYCDVPQVLRLACTDTSVLEFLVISNSGMLDVTWFLLLLVSYSAILVMLRSHSGKARRKAASTCTTHIIVMSVVFIPSIYLYARPFSSFSVVQAVSISHTVKNPMLAHDRHPDEPGDAGSTQEITLTSVGLYKGMTVGRSLWPCFPLVEWRESFCVCRVHISWMGCDGPHRSKCTVNLSNIFRFLGKWIVSLFLFLMVV